MTDRFRPLPRHDAPRPPEALPLAGGPLWFTHAVRHRRGAHPEPIAAAALPEEVRVALTAPRAPFAGLAMDRGPHLMGIVNVTPDSFSDGGRLADTDAAASAALAMAAAGAAILDIGGESTRPGATEVPAEEEIARVVPVIERLCRKTDAPVSIDTRKAAVARAAADAGARILNDVSALGFDPDMAGFCADAGLPVVLMHAQGSPETMQDAPRYDDVLLDVYDALEARVAMAEAAGVPRARIAVDPGIGFGKTVAHNLALLRGIALFHGLGCPILLGASRKGFIGQITGASAPDGRMPGSVAVALAAMAQGVQILRVHDVAETAQALRMWQAVHEGEWSWVASFSEPTGCAAPRTPTR